MVSHFELLPFLIGLAVGIVGILFFKPPPRIIIKYPHPTNVEQSVYKDPNGVCYTYKAKEVQCDANEANLKPYPLQEGMPVEN